MDKTKLRKFIGKRISEARTVRNLSQSEVAEALDIPSGYYAMLENGEAMIASPYLYKLLGLFDISMFGLMTGSKATDTEEEKVFKYEHSGIVLDLETFEPADVCFIFKAFMERRKK